MEASTSAKSEMTSNSNFAKEEAQILLNNEHTSTPPAKVTHPVAFRAITTPDQPAKELEPPTLPPTKTSRPPRPAQHSIFSAPATLQTAVSDAEYNVMIDALVAAAERPLSAEVADAIVKRFLGGDRVAGFGEVLKGECCGVDGVVRLGMLVVLGWMAVVTW